jgi:hypothetical protein
VAREVGDVTVEVRAESAFDCLPDRRVEARAASCGQLVFERAPQQHMCERVAARRIARLDEDARLDCRIEDVEQALLGEGDHIEEEAELEILADERRDLEHAAAVRG